MNLGLELRARKEEEEKKNEAKKSQKMFIISSKYKNTNINNFEVLSYFNQNGNETYSKFWRGYGEK